MGELLLTRFVETTALLQLFTPHLSTAYPPGKSWFEKESKQPFFNQRNRFGILTFRQKLAADMHEKAAKTGHFVTNGLSAGGPFTSLIPILPCSRARF